MDNNYFDFIVVGAGLFGAAFASTASSLGKRVLVIDKNSCVGGACYTEMVDGVPIHRHGPHIFHTNNSELWQWIQLFGEFKPFTNQPIAKYKDKIYNLPFNMNTFYQLYGAQTPRQAEECIKADCVNLFGNSIEDFGYRALGNRLYLTLIKDYTEKQWGRRCSELPQSFIERLPLRFEFNNNYFTDRFQGVPVEGYTPLIKNMLKDSQVMLNTSFQDLRTIFPDIWANKIIYTGSIDEFYNYSLGELQYRSLCWEDRFDRQGCAVVNYTDDTTPYTRSIEHRLFVGDYKSKPYTTFERAVEWKEGLERYYPIPTEKNLTLYNQYLELAQKENPNIIFCGRIGGYKYINMDTAVEQARELAFNLI